MDLKPNLVHGASLRARTHVQSGNFASDMCYMNRNTRTASCEINKWPQEKGNFCLGNVNEVLLMDCLRYSGEAGWWQSFPGCTSAEQCLENAKQTHKKLTGLDY